MRTHPTGSCPFCKRTSIRLDKAGNLQVHQPTLVMPRHIKGTDARCPGSGRSSAKPPPEGREISWCALCDDGGAKWNGYAYVHDRCVEEARDRAGVQQRKVLPHSRSDRFA